IAAAASRSPGIESKNRLSRKMLKALATEGSQIASGEPIRFRCRSGRSDTVTYCGTSSTVAGIISVATVLLVPQYVTVSDLQHRGRDHQRGQHQREDDVAEHRPQPG